MATNQSIYNLSPKVSWWFSHSEPLGKFPWLTTPRPPPRFGVWSLFWKVPFAKAMTNRFQEEEIWKQISPRSRKTMDHYPLRMPHFFPILKYGYEQSLFDHWWRKTINNVKLSENQTLPVKKPVPREKKGKSSNHRLLQVQAATCHKTSGFLSF